MSRTVDHYCFLISPWTYLASARLDALARRTGATVNTKPIDPMRTFAEMGGQPPAKRHPSRQRHRLAELERWSRHLGVAMNLEPAHFPADQGLAARAVYALGGADGSAPARALADAVLRAVWAEERDIADEATLRALVDGIGEDGTATLERARTEAMGELYRRTTDEAHGRDVFGAPTYVVDGELFWGQDRLDFLERRLAG